MSFSGFGNFQSQGSVSNLGLVNIADTVVLRLYLSNDTDQAGDNEESFFDNVVIHGSTEIPEPASFALIVLAAGGLALRRSRTDRGC